MAKSECVFCAQPTAFCKGCVFLHPMQQQKLTPNQALPKLKQYCGYQERCHSEVREKLASYGVYGQDADAIAATLVAENYLNEERFALQFAGGRFRLKQWGRNKIQYELRQKQVSAYCIKKALASIDQDAYQATLEQLYEQKWASLRSEKNIFTKKKKTQAFLMQKGYETGLINELLHQKIKK
jgi:regulatory protein